MLSEEDVKTMLENLRTGKEAEIHVHKDDFLLFRSILMKQQDKIKFIGKAKKGGVVFYSYRKVDEIE